MKYVVEPRDNHEHGQWCMEFGVRDEDSSSKHGFVAFAYTQEGANWIARALEIYDQHIARATEELIELTKENSLTSAWKTLIDKYRLTANEIDEILEELKVRLKRG